ncbi:XAC2610-related protein [Longimicrobium sp.]|uniref:XAC2610-related protein n=1 Tax=Longimicrobium sp. TaxID=2029185 RepID=UPI003B3B76CB
MRTSFVARPCVRLLIPAVLWIASGCAPDERVPSPPSVVVPATDTTITTTTLVPADTTATTRTDTGQAARERWDSPRDCRFTDGRPRPDVNDPGYGERYDSAVMARGIPFRCTLRPGGPEVRLVLRGEWSIPTILEVFSPPDAPRPLQTLTVDHDQSAYEGNELLVGEDLNGDGWMDLRVNTWYGSAGQMSEVFRYDPSVRRFVPDTALPGMNVHRLAGRPCVATSTKSGASDYSTAEYCWSGGTWVQTRAFSQELLRGGSGRGGLELGAAPVVRILSERRGGRMRLVRHDTVPENAPQW